MLHARNTARGDPCHVLVLADLVIIAGCPNPIPFRTRPLNASAPMVLRLKTRESRSSPGPPRPEPLFTSQTPQRPTPASGQANGVPNAPASGQSNGVPKGQPWGNCRGVEQPGS